MEIGQFRAVSTAVDDRTEPDLLSVLKSVDPAFDSVPSPFDPDPSLRDPGRGQGEVRRGRVRSHVWPDPGPAGASARPRGPTPSHSDSLTSCCTKRSRRSCFTGRESPSWFPRRNDLPSTDCSTQRAGARIRQAASRPGRSWSRLHSMCGCWRAIARKNSGRPGRKCAGAGQQTAGRGTCRSSCRTSSHCPTSWTRP